jgi:hypothetical protein
LLAIVAFRRLARILAVTSGMAALGRALPLFVVVGLVSAIVFPGNGMQAADLIGAMEGSVFVRAFLWGVWILVTAPVATVMLEAPTTFFLRALPAPRWHFLVTHAGMLFALEAPWFALFARGRGALPAFAATLAAAALALGAVARPRRPLEILAVVAVLATVAAVVGAAITLAVSAAAGPLLLVRAWSRAPERDARVRSAFLPRPGFVALAALILALLRRSERAALARGLVAAAAGALVFGLFERDALAAAPADLVALELHVGAAPLAVAVGSLALPAFAVERTLRSVIESAGTSIAARVAAQHLALAVAGAAFGAFYGALAALGTGRYGVPLVWIVASAAASGVGFGMCAAACARGCEKKGEIDGTSFVLRLLGLTALFAALVSLGGPRALVTWLVVALALAARDLKLEEVRRR